MEIVTFSGWNRNARLTCNETEMIVTLEVGPRIISYGRIGGPNELAVRQSTAGMVGGDTFRSYGGHRLWVAPEQSPSTFQPDNDPVEYEIEDKWHVFTSPPDRFHIQKQIRILPDEQADRFVLEHRVYNLGAYDVELAPWTPTQFATGGECILPQAAHIPHSEKVLPARPLVLWNYTRMDDPRYTWGQRVIRLRQADMGPTKVGALVQQGYAAYVNHGNTYLRRFAFEEGATYPDFGVNFESFTREDMLEVESLSPLQTVRRGGGYAVHRETWYLISGETAPDGDEECGEWLQGLAATRPL